MTLVLVDASVWARRLRPAVSEPLGDAIEEHRVVVIEPVILELLRGVRDAREVIRQARRYDALRKVPLGPRLERRARDVQVRLSWRGYHRGPSPLDLLAAAAAESVDAELWHCDRHFELIAEVTGQPMRRVGT